jgi:hypothetical protein
VSSGADPGAESKRWKHLLVVSCMCLPALLVVWFFLSAIQALNYDVPSARGEWAVGLSLLMVAAAWGGVGVATAAIAVRGDTPRQRRLSAGGAIIWLIATVSIVTAVVRCSC